MTLTVEGTSIGKVGSTDHHEALTDTHIRGEFGIQFGITAIHHSSKDVQLSASGDLHGSLFVEGRIHGRRSQVASASCLLTGVKTVSVAIRGVLDSLISLFCFILRDLARGGHGLQGGHKGVGHHQHLAVVGLAGDNLLEQVANLLDEGVLAFSLRRSGNGINLLLQRGAHLSVEVGIELHEVGALVLGILCQHVLGTGLHVRERGIQSVASLGQFTQIGELQVTQGNPLLARGQQMTVGETDGQRVVRHIGQDAHGIATREEGAGGTLLSMGGVTDGLLHVVLDGIVSSTRQPAVHLVLCISSGKHILIYSRQVILVVVQINHCRMLVCVGLLGNTIGSIEGEFIDTVLGQRDGLVHVEGIVRPALGDEASFVALALGSGGHESAFPGREVVRKVGVGDE